MACWADCIGPLLGAFSRPLGSSHQSHRYLPSVNWTVSISSTVNDPYQAGEPDGSRETQVIRELGNHERSNEQARGHRRDNRALRIRGGIVKGREVGGILMIISILTQSSSRRVYAQIGPRTWTKCPAQKAHHRYMRMNLQCTSQNRVCRMSLPCTFSGRTGLAAMRALY
jgi:hypothetical protein